MLILFGNVFGQPLRSLSLSLIHSALAFSFVDQIALNSNVSFNQSHLMTTLLKRRTSEVIRYLWISTRWMIACSERLNESSQKKYLKTRNFINTDDTHIDNNCILTNNYSANGGVKKKVTAKRLQRVSMPSKQRIIDVQRIFPSNILQMLLIMSRSYFCFFFLFLVFVLSALIKQTKIQPNSFKLKFQ